MNFTLCHACNRHHEPEHTLASIKLIFSVKLKKALRALIFLFYCYQPLCTLAVTVNCIKHYAFEIQKFFVGHNWSFISLACLYEKWNRKFIYLSPNARAFTKYKICMQTWMNAVCSYLRYGMNFSFFHSFTFLSWAGNLFVLLLNISDESSLIHFKGIFRFCFSLMQIFLIEMFL